MTQPSFLLSFTISLLLRWLLPLRGVSSASSSTLQFHVPHSLTKAGGYRHREALFGQPPYGSGLSAQLYYAKSTLCSDDIHTKDWVPHFEKPPFILMVDRGECSFVQKVRRAQKTGAAAVLIADNTCLCHDAECIDNTDVNQVSCEQLEPIMADDGSGSDVSIPSFLMYKQDADAVKTVMLTGQPVRVEMKFEIPAPDDRVEYELWTDPLDSASVKFLLTFHKAAVKLGEKAYFTPHQYIADGNLLGCTLNVGHDDICADLCTNMGRYCSFDPDHVSGVGISGADMVRESLRRICIWEVYGKSDGIGLPWWIYIDEFMYRCVDPMRPEMFMSDVCIEQSMQHAQIDKNKINACIQQSGGLEANSTNTLLEAALADMEREGVVILPTMFVNGVQLRGQLSTTETFRAICSGFYQGSEPSICKTCQHCQNMTQCLSNSKCPAGAGGGGDGISGVTFGVTILGLTLLFTSIGYIQYRRQQQFMREQVRGILADYVQLDRMQEPMDTSLALQEEDGEGGGHYSIS